MSVGTEAELIVGRASPARFAKRALLAAVILASLSVAGYFGYRYWQAHKVRSAPMVAYAEASVRIGNNARGRDWREDRHEGLQERPAHEVLVKAFELDVNEVTVAQYAVCVSAGDCTKPVKGKQCNWAIEDQAQHPINCVTHQQAEQFCQWAGKRLPTEVQWEYAAGGSGDKRLFPWGSRQLPSAEHANVCGSECRHGAKPTSAIYAVFEFDDKWPATAPVGSFAKGDTPEGLKDMAGNVWEWTSSAPCDYPKHDCPLKAEAIIRGGGWTHRFVLSPEVTTREKLARDKPSEGVGFRCAR